MQLNEIKTLTYINSSGRPILRGLHDPFATSYADEIINFAEVVETLEDLEKISTTKIFIRSLENKYEKFITLLENGLNLSSDVKNFENIILVMEEIYLYILDLKPSACKSFVTTHIKPFLKEYRHTS